MATNPIMLENAILEGRVDPSYWDAPSSRQIEGFAADFSVNVGSSVNFKINVNGTANATLPYKIEIFRLGYYGGSGAREVAEIVNADGTVQPNPLFDGSRGLVDAGNWSVTDSWQVPPNAVSGVYLARLQRLDASGNPIAGATNQIPFIVRNDGVAADVVLQTSDTTWQAYNSWGGNNGVVGPNLYSDPANILEQERAYAVSYNRPFITREASPHNYLFGADYAAIYWLERNGYNVSYMSGVDTDRLGTNYLTNYKAYISVGHDEYWSGDQRAHVEAARDAGVNLLWWSGNEVFWKTRWDTAISADGTPYRTLVSYKETHANTEIDPSNEWTGTWRDLRFLGSPTATGQEPENSLTGQLFVANGTGEGGALDVPASYGSLRYWRNTAATNGELDVAPGLIGYEWDVVPDDKYRPAGLIKLSETTLNWSALLVDQGSRYAPGTATHNLSLYRDAESGALVFGAGTVFWSWGLSNEHDMSPYGASIENALLKQFTVNLFADMGVQPGSLEAGLTLASPSTDHIGAVADMTDLPAEHAARTSLLITGTATDNDSNPATADGVVALVEISFDGGLTWKAAQGTATWSYLWTPTVLGTYNVNVRAIDDSLNIRNLTLDQDTVVVKQPPPPSTVSLFDPTYSLPSNTTTSNDTANVELGMRFTASKAGQITQLKYYRSSSDASDTDVREGHLWRASDGALLGTVTFTSTSGQSGWQVANLSTPISLSVGTQYIVSYHTANNYLKTPGFFAPGNEVTFDGVDDDAFSDPFSMLHASQDGTTGGNGVYAYGTTLVAPTSTYESTNYWVDVTFRPVQTGSNNPPVFTSSNFTVNENVTAVGTVAATDADGDSLTYAIASGADAALFNINAATGALSFKSAPNFEAPADFGANNVYDLKLSVTDGRSTAVTKDIQVTVQNVDEAPPPSTVSLFDPTYSLPSNTTTSNDTANVELGMRFTASKAGQITQLKYYRSSSDASDTDVREGHLWRASDGALLGTVTFTSTSGQSGWQVANLSTPISLSVGTQYIVSYHTANNYLKTPGFFAPGNEVTFDGVDDDAFSDPFSMLHASQDGTTGGNGVYAYGTTLVAPTSTYESTNYWVDVTFRPVQTGSNNPPVFTSSNFTVNENVTAVGTVAATDADGDSLTYAIASGADAALFNINAATGALSFKSAPNFEAPADFGANNVYDLKLSVTDGRSTAVTKDIQVTVQNVDEAPQNNPPVFTSSNFTVNENVTAVGTVAATDADGDSLTYAIASGADAALFNINAATGALSFKSAPNFEAPADFGANNVYDLKLSVTDGRSTAVTKDIQVTVQNVDEAPQNNPPVFTSSNFTVNENVTAVGTVAATDADGDSLTYAIASGADAALFNINAATGALSFKSAPNFEAPADFGANNVYDLKLSVTDGRSTAVTKDIQVTMLDVDEFDVTRPIDSNVAANIVSVGAPAGTTVGVTASAVDRDATTNAVTYSLTNNADGRFLINATTGVVSVAASASFDFNTAPTHNITVLATSADGSAASETFVVDVNAASRVGVTLTSAADTYSAPNGQSYEIQGLDGNDVITTSGGDDLVNGGAGNDTISTGAGNDVIVGGSGSDVLNGGQGADIFVYLATSDSFKNSSDIVNDFTVGGDKIDLSALDANISAAGSQDFTFIGTSAFSNVPGQVRYDTTPGKGQTQVYADVNGDKRADLEITLKGIMPLSATDFVL